MVAILAFTIFLMAFWFCTYLIFDQYVAIYAENEKQATKDQKDGNKTNDKKVSESKPLAPPPKAGKKEEEEVEIVSQDR